MVTIPNTVGEDENLPGRETEGENYHVDGGPAITWSGNKVQYDQVVGEYSRQALSDIENSGYPAGVQEIIKEYFENIQ